MNRFQSFESSPLFKGITVCLIFLLALSGCGQAVVQILPPFHQKVRIGDGVKITVTDGTIHSGRVFYIDRSVVVIRTPKQIVSESPVKSVRFGTKIPWEEIRVVKVAGTLDSRRKLISNEEIRVNRRGNLRRNLAVNIGLLGLTASFLGGVKFQDSISPATADLSTYRHGKARAAFWTTWIGGALGGALLAYKLGDHFERRQAIARIERLRATKLDSLQTARLPQTPATP